MLAVLANPGARVTGRKRGGKMSQEEVRLAVPLGADGHPGAVGTLSRARQAKLRVKVPAGESLRPGDHEDLTQIGRPGQWLGQINHNPGGKSGGR